MYRFAVFQGDDAEYAPAKFRDNAPVADAGIRLDFHAQRLCHNLLALFPPKIRPLAQDLVFEVAGCLHSKIITDLIRAWKARNARGPRTFRADVIRHAPIDRTQGTEYSMASAGYGERLGKQSG